MLGYYILVYLFDRFLTAKPSYSKRLQPMSTLRPLATNVKVAVEVCQPLLVTDVRILPSMCIGSFENVRSCGLLFSLNNTA